MSSFYLNEGWYSSEQLAEVLEANKILNNHLAKAIGELPEGYTLTTHKVNPESLEGAAGAVVAMTQDRSTEVTAQPEPYPENFIDALRFDTALREPEPEPVAWMRKDKGHIGFHKVAPSGYVPLYTASPQREWVGLSDEEIAEIGKIWLDGNRMLPFPLAKAIEAKLKEKNNGNN